jgi:hypothetical protein
VFEVSFDSVAKGIDKLHLFGFLLIVHLLNSVITGFSVNWISLSSTAVVNVVNFILHWSSNVSEMAPSMILLNSNVSHIVSISVPTVSFLVGNSHLST